MLKIFGTAYLHLNQRKMLAVIHGNYLLGSPMNDTDTSQFNK